MNPIKNLKELRQFLFNEWGIKEMNLANINYRADMKSGNLTLDYYSFAINPYIENTQDYFGIKLFKNENQTLVQFINENSGNWILATLPNSLKVYCNEWWISEDEGNPNEFRLMDFDLEECLISFTLQELYFDENEEYTIELDNIDEFKKSCYPIWLNKSYVWNEPSHSFYYNEEYGALLFEHLGNTFNQIRIRNVNDYKKLKHFLEH